MPRQQNSSSEKFDLGNIEAPFAGGTQGLPKNLGRVSRQLSAGSSLLKNPASTPSVVLTAVALHLSELGFCCLRQIGDVVRGFRLAIDDLENPAGGAVDFQLVSVVALADVGPVGDIHAAIWAVFAVESAEPGVS